MNKYIIIGLKICFLLFFVIGRKKLEFVPRRFVCPPREFRLLYGPELRQSTISNFVVKVEKLKNSNPVIKKRSVVQSKISSYFSVRKWIWNKELELHLYFSFISDGYNSYLVSKVSVLRRCFYLQRLRVRGLKNRLRKLKEENFDLKKLIKRYEKFDTM